MGPNDAPNTNAIDYGFGATHDPDSIGGILRTTHEGDETLLDAVDLLTTDAEGNPIERPGLIVQRRKLLPEPPRHPTRKESPRRAHVFNSRDALAEYLMAYGSANTVVLADVENDEISAVLDERAADGYEVITYTPVMHPKLTPWDEIVGKPLPIAAFSDFILTNRRVIVRADQFTDGRTLALSLSQVRASKDVQVERGHKTESVNSIRVTTKIQGVQDNQIVNLPDTITVECPLYVDSPGVSTFEFDLTLSTPPGADTTITATLLTADILVARADEFQSIVDDLRRRAGEATGEVKLTVGLGHPRHGQWDYLPETR